jgi:hypothetical protein
MRSKPTPVPALPPTASAIPTPPAPPRAAPAVKPAAGRDETPPVPALAKGTKLVAAPPSKRSDGSEKRATRRRAKDRKRR